MTDTFTLDPVEQFLAIADAHPDEIAVHDDSTQESYADFAKSVRRIAAWVAGQAVGPHPRVLVISSQGANAYSAMLGTLMGGGNYAPISLESPAERQRMIAETFVPDLLITDAESTDWLDSLGGSIPTLVLPYLQGDELEKPASASPVAYTMFTSGSTGIPKGVVIGRAALEHYLGWLVPALGLGPGQSCSQHPNIGFDFSVAEIYAALSSGSTLIPIADSVRRLFPARAIRDFEIDVWVSVPSVIDLMQRAGEVTAENFASLRLMYFCGEPLLKSHLDAIFSANPSVLVMNTYGPTEATVSCTSVVLTVDDYEAACDASVALGAANPSMEICLEGGQNADEGEIVIYGPQVAEGYWRDDARTDEVFGTSPETGARFYRTGDWAYRRNGHFFFSHRKDNQVKLHGHRIELAEIDVAVRHELGGKAVASILVDERLITFVESREPVDVAGIQEALRQRLPDYMIPREIRTLPELPRNANDKIDIPVLQSVSEDG